MTKFLMRIFILFLAVNIWNLGFFAPLTADFGGEAALVEAHHKPWHSGGGGNDKCKKNPKKCKPPTVSELPIQTMVLSGVVVIALSGGMVFLIRKRKTKSSLEA